MAVATQARAEAGARRGLSLSQSVKAVLAIAKSTFKDTWRQRILLILLVFGMVIIPASLIFSWLSAGEEIKFVVDTGLGTILLFGILMAIFMGASMIPSELERRTIFTVLSKPVRRIEFVLGKFLGACLTLLVNVLLMGVVFLAAYMFKQASLQAPATQNLTTLIQAVVLIYFQVVLLAAIAVTISTVAGLWFNVIFSFFIYFVGNMGEVVTHVSDHAQVQILRLTSGILSKLLPHFENYDLRQKLLLDEVVPWSYVGVALGYTLLYVGVMLLIAYLLFNEREF